MIRKSSEMEQTVRENMRGGQGKITITQIFKQEELKGHCRLCARITIGPGDSIGFHEHVDEEEIFLILRGRGEVVENGSKQEVVAGDAILTGGGAGHAIKNIGNEPLELIGIILLYS
ncbi:MAG: cupin domain-containing protein [candidate division KSB1 bacterium]|nr:cupin domain-containing protein [candidate division KSB1 bacterium]